MTSGVGKAPPHRYVDRFVHGVRVAELRSCFEKQLDCASLEASSRLLLENDLPSNQAIKFSEYLDKNSFDSIRKTPVPDPKNPEGMEMDS